MLFLYVEIGELLLEVGDLGGVVDHDVGIVGMMDRVILVVGLGGIEGFQRDELRDDRTGKDSGLIELVDIGVCDVLLVGTREKNYGAILRAGVGSLAIRFRGIVRDEEKNFQKLAESDLGGIEDYFYGFGVAGSSGAYGFIFGGIGLAAGIAGCGGGDSLYVFEHALNSPEAAAGENDFLLALCSG